MRSMQSSSARLFPSVRNYGGQRGTFSLLFERYTQQSIQGYCYAALHRPFVAGCDSHISQQQIYGMGLTCESKGLNVHPGRAGRKSVCFRDSWRVRALFIETIHLHLSAKQRICFLWCPQFGICNHSVRLIEKYNKNQELGSVPGLIMRDSNMLR